MKTSLMSSKEKSLRNWRGRGAPMDGRGGGGGGGEVYVNLRIRKSDQLLCMEKNLN